MNDENDDIYDDEQYGGKVSNKNKYVDINKHENKNHKKSYNNQITKKHYVHNPKNYESVNKPEKHYEFKTWHLILIKWTIIAIILIAIIVVIIIYIKKIKAWFNNLKDKLNPKNIIKDKLNPVKWFK